MNGSKAKVSHDGHRSRASDGAVKSHSDPPPNKKANAVPPGFIATIPGKTVLSVSMFRVQPINTEQLKATAVTLHT